MFAQILQVCSVCYMNRRHSLMRSFNVFKDKRVCFFCLLTKWMQICTVMYLNAYQPLKSCNHEHLHYCTVGMQPLSSVFPTVSPSFEFCCLVELFLTSCFGSCQVPVWLHLLHISVPGKGPRCLRPCASTRKTLQWPGSGKRPQGCRTGNAEPAGGKLQWGGAKRHWART